MKSTLLSRSHYSNLFSPTVIIIFREYRKLAIANVLFPPTRGSAAFTLNVVLFCGKTTIQVSVPAAQWPVRVNGATASEGFFFKETEKRERDSARLSRHFAVRLLRSSSLPHVYSAQFIFFSPLHFLRRQQRAAQGRAEASERASERAVTHIRQSSKAQLSK